MAYDHVLERLGQFGRYQARVYFLLCLPAIICAFHKQSWVFLGAKVDHRCQLPFEEANATYILDPHIASMSLPWNIKQNAYSSCERFDTNFTNDYFNSKVPATNTIHCSKWVYDKSVYETSAVIEWDLVCGKGWLRASADSTLMVGVLLGSIIFGDLSDRFGRKPIFFASLVIQVVAGLLAAVAPEFFTFVLARMVIGATTSGVFLVAYVIALEMVGPSKRLLAGVVVQMFFSCGFILTGVLAYFITDWRWLQIALSLPGLGFMCYWWLIPESARWLITKNRSEEAVDILIKVAKQNRVEISREEIHALLLQEDEVLLEKNVEEGETIVLSPKIDDKEKNGIHEENKPLNHTNGTLIKKEAEQEKKPSPSVLDIFKYPNLRRRSLIIFFNWIVNSATYYGLSWNTSDLGGNHYVNYIISGLVEIPAYIWLLCTLNRFGRKFTLCGALLVTGSALLLTHAVPTGNEAISIAFAMLGKLAITASYGTAYIFTAEQFPTVIRNVGLGAASTSARFGSILTPYVNHLADYWKPLPLLVYGSLSFTAGLTALLLPETLNRKLPETIEDGEKFGRRRNDLAD